MKTKSLIISAFTAMAALSACTEDESILGSNGNRLDVSASIPALTRAAIEGTQLPENAQLGVSLFNPDGSDYDGKQQGYKNVLYKSEILTTGGVKWSSANPIILSPSKGKAVAYYPYSAAVADISAIPVETASQTDYLFSDWVSDLSFKNPQANFAMNHALCAVQINLVNEDYTAGPGEVTQISVASPALATTASLNANTGTLSTFAGQGDAITVDKTITLTGESQGTKIIAIPTGAQDNLTVKVVVDGATSTVPVTLNQPFVQGKAYVVNLKVKDAKTPVELVSVSVKEWTEEQLGDFDAPVMDDKYSIEVTIPSNGEAFQSNVYGFTGTIDWGDGTKTSHSNDNNPSHTYANAGKYTITHRGKCPRFKYSYSNRNSAKCITDIIYIGRNLGLVDLSYAFYYCENLTELRNNILDNCCNVTKFERTFEECVALKAIPTGLFDNCSNATSFRGTFKACKALTEIPSGLFDNCTKVETFSQVFSSLILLKSIPQGIFDNCSNVKSFERTFGGCMAISSIPTDLFKNNIKATDFEATFINCVSLTIIPEGLFKNCSGIKEFYMTFYGCEALSTLPSGLFENCNSVLKFDRTFMYCYKLKELPDMLFNDCNNAQSFSETFWGCEALTTIPERLFEKCVNAYYFDSTFQECRRLESIPQGLFDNCTKANRFNGTFTLCEALTIIPVGLFCNNRHAKAFDGTFSYCTKLSNIPDGLFDNCTEVTSFIGTFGKCTKLTTIPTGLFDNCTRVTNFSGTFEKCTKLTTIPTGLFDNCTEVESFYKTFVDCTELTGESPYTIIDKIKVHLYEREGYSGYGKPFTNPDGEYCFKNCTKLTDYEQIPTDWK